MIRFHIIVAVLTLAIQSASAAPSAQAVTVASIEGIATDKTTGNPIATAQVSFTSSVDPPNPFNGPNPMPRRIVTGDFDGAFTWSSVPPGNYKLFS